MSAVCLQKIASLLQAVKRLVATLAMYAKYPNSFLNSFYGALFAAGTNQTSGTN